MRPHNYLAKVLALDFAPGSVSVVHVFHDDGCARFKGGVCVCDPDIEVCAGASCLYHYAGGTVN